MGKTGAMIAATVQNPQHRRGAASNRREASASATRFGSDRKARNKVFLRAAFFGPARRNERDSTRTPRFAQGVTAPAFSSGRIANLRMSWQHKARKICLQLANLRV
jgi:hypothetical protein